MRFFKQSPKENKDLSTQGIQKDLKANISLVKEATGESVDFISRTFKLDENGKSQVGLFYVEGISDTEVIRNNIISSLMFEVKKIYPDFEYSPSNIFNAIKDLILPDGDVNPIEDFSDFFNHVYSGDTIILIDGFDKGFYVSTRKWQDRGVNEPSSEIVIRGPKDGFTETLRTNTALLRRRIKSQKLWFEALVIGKYSKTDVVIAYIKDIADEKLVDEVKKRLNRIDIDGILDSGQVEQLIEDEGSSFFPTVFSAERPDVTSAALLEGRIAIIVDGSPFVLIAPTIFIHFLQSPEDYYQKSRYATLIRILRFCSLFIALLGPSLYITFTTFHQEAIPLELLSSIISQQGGIPFPILVESLIMEISFEILREANARMPQASGSAISTVGAIIIGQAAVVAGIVSPLIIIVVALTAITSLIVPSNKLANSIRASRFFFMFMAAFFGLYGILMGLILLVLHLASIRSFGIPYLAPYAPFNLSEQKDSIIKYPLWKIGRRPKLYNSKNINRQADEKIVKPQPNS